MIRESCQCLRQAKELVIDCLEADWDRQRLESQPELLSQVRGALAMIPLQVTGWRMAKSPRRVFNEYWVPRVSTAFCWTCWLT